jgi:DNA repair exonuclease SbcCD nuclease subunit
VRKILHAADIHLDSPLQKLDTYDQAPVEQIRGASRRALENMVRLAIDQSVDLVVIAGDLYDGDWTDQNTGLFFVAQASKLTGAGIPLVVIRGNHDAENLMTSSLPLPKNPDGSEIMMRADKVDLRVFESIGVAVHGRSFQRRAEMDNLALEYPKPLGGMFNLGLLHTSLTGAEGHDPYAPCTPAQLAEKHYDYWALGHIHQRGEHGLADAAPVVFSGNLQGRHIREAGEKGCVLLNIDPSGHCQRVFTALDVVRWQLCTIDVTDMSHTDEVIDAFQSWLADSVPRADQRLLVTRVQLVGATSLHTRFHRQRSQLQAALRATSVSHGADRVWLETLRVKITPRQEVATAVELEGPLESLAAVIDDLKADPQLKTIVEGELRGLIKKLPAEVDGGDRSLDVDNPQWIEQLIESASAEIQGRLQTPEVRT